MSDLVDQGTTKLSAADLRRILHALLVSVLEVRQMVAAASTTLSVDDYGDALAAATRRLELMEGCVRGLLGVKDEEGKRGRGEEETCLKDELPEPPVAEPRSERGTTMREEGGEA